ncbi:MAG: M24 family metallopeptidase [Anaerolineales bacterium]
MLKIFEERCATFKQSLAGVADLAFLPVSADLQYLTGLERGLPSYGEIVHPGAWMEGAWISPSKGPLMTLSRMSVEFGGLDPDLGPELRILEDSADPTDELDRVLDQFDPRKISSIALGDRTRSRAVLALQALLPDAILTSATDLVIRQRMIKSEHEISLMRRAGAITEAAFSDVIDKLKVRMTELDVLAEIDFQLRRHGALAPSFPTALYCSGPDHPLVFGQPQRTMNRILNPPVSVLFDMGAVYEGYCYDYGRTVAFGEPHQELIHAYDLVHRSQAAGVRTLRAGSATAESVDEAARELIATAGYGELFRHRLGHGIGLDVHEPPFLAAGDGTRLRKGMLFTVEPSITRMAGFSARVEDVVLAAEGGGVPLTDGFRSLLVIS